MRGLILLIIFLGGCSSISHYPDPHKPYAVTQTYRYCAMWGNAMECMTVKDDGKEKHP